MKIGVIGAGAVGAACIMSIIGRGAAHEIVVIDKDEGRVRGLVTDMQYGTPLCPPVRLIGGDYPDLFGAELILVTVGINEKAGGAMDRNDPAGCGCSGPMRRSSARSFRKSPRSRPPP